MILSIDPGTTESAWMLFDDVDTKKPVLFAKEANDLVLEKMRLHAKGLGPFAVCDIAVCEMMQSYGRVGATTFETCVWIGRFKEAWNGDFRYLYRYQVKKHLCPKQKANDATVRKALIDRFGQPGTKKKPGPTHGITADVWSAFAIAVTFVEHKEPDVKPKKRTRTKNSSL
jgi:hypothetical protein